MPKCDEPGGVKMIVESGLNDYLLDAIEQGASDLHITVGIPPRSASTARFRRSTTRT